MAERPVGVTDQAAGAGVAEVRTRERSVGGNTVAEQYVIPILERVPSNKGTMSSFRTPARAVASLGSQSLLTIENKTGSGLLVAVRQISVSVESVAAKAVIAPIVRTMRCTAPTNGTVQTKGQTDTADTASASVEVRGDASADGTSSASALGATHTERMWSRFSPRFHTLVGQQDFDELFMTPLLMPEYPTILREGQACGLVLVNNSGAAWTANDWHFLMSAAWEEFTLP